jgi:hypothetical protein
MTGRAIGQQRALAHGSLRPWSDAIPFGSLAGRRGVAVSDRRPAPLLAGPETATRTRVSSVELAVTRGLRMAKGLDEVARPLIPGRAVLAHARQEIGAAGLAPQQRQEGDDQRASQEVRRCLLDRRGDAVVIAVGPARPD